MTTHVRVRQTDIKNFIECRRKSMLMWARGHYPVAEYDGPRTPQKRDIGTLVHAGIQAYYDGVEAIPTMVEAAAIEITGEEEPTGEWPGAITLATRMVDSYIRWVEYEMVDDQLQVLATEITLRWEWHASPDLVFDIEGTLDLLVSDRITHQYGIGDLKTRDQFALLRPGNFQLLTYGVLCRKAKGFDPGFAYWNEIKRNKRTAAAKPPFERRQTLTLSSEILDRHEELLTHNLLPAMAQMWHHAHDGETIVDAHHTIAPPNMTGECSWKCEVSQLCDTMHDPEFDWVDMAKDYFTQTQETE